MAEPNFFEKSQKVLKFFQIWSLNNSTNKTKRDYIILKYWVIIFCGCSIGVLSFLDVVEAIKNDKVDDIFTKILFLCVALVVNQKVFTVTYTEQQILECINQLNIFSLKFQDKTDFNNSHEFYKKIFNAGAFILNVNVFVFMLAPTFFLQDKKLFFQPTISFINLKESPVMEFMIIYEFISAFILTNITLGYDTIFCGMLCISAGALKSICREIREIDKVIEDHKLSEAKLKNIIEKIIEISSFTDKISDTFAVTTMLHIIYICGTLALALYMMSIKPLNDLTCFSMLLASIMSVLLLWMYCYFGQIIVDQRQLLKTELYFLRWYMASKNLKTMILVSMSVLQKDQFIYAGKLIPLSMETFGQVLRKAYVYFTFMKGVKE